VLELTFGSVVDDAHGPAGVNFHLDCIRDVDRSVELSSMRSSPRARPTARS